jgi:hypothetical protein
MCLYDVEDGVIGTYTFEIIDDLANRSSRSRERAGQAAMRTGSALIPRRKFE